MENELTDIRKPGGMEKGLTTHDQGGRFTGTRDFTSQQKIFIQHMIKNGGDKIASAIAARYADPTQSAWQNLQNPLIRQAIHEGRERELEGLACLGMKVIREILENEHAPFGVRANLALKMVEHKHDPQIEAMKALSSKGLDEMSPEELIAHADKLDGMLRDMGVMIDITPAGGISGTTANGDTQPSVNNDDSTVSIRQSSQTTPSPPTPALASESDGGARHKILQNENLANFLAAPLPNA